MGYNIHMCVQVIQQSESGFDIAVSIINVLISFCMLIVSVIGVVCVFNYHQHQKEAVYGFYANMRTFLTGFLVHIRSGDGNPLPWMHILSKSNAETNDTDRRIIAPVVAFSKAFFDFLSTAPNQIPPSKRKDKTATWENAFRTLRTSLVDIINFDIQAFPEWTDTTQIYKELNDAVDNIFELMDEAQPNYSKLKKPSKLTK